MSNYKLLTGDMGRLYPFGLHEVLPNDSFNHSAQLFMRFSPMAAPVMHPVTVRVHHFFVPHRLTWPTVKGGEGVADTGWEGFITSGKDGTDSQTIPVETVTPAEGDLLDYLGLPTGITVDVSALPLRAVNMVYNEWFRDQDLSPIRLLDDTTVPLVAWEKDYFTTARPWPQKGPAVTLPLGDSAPVIGDPDAVGGPSFTATSGGFETNSLVGLGSNSAGFSGTMSATSIKWNDTQLLADLSSAEGVNITAFREAFALQRYAEARARYGSRYVEYLRYLGVRSQLDERLQRPELLGSGRARVNISEVLQTSNTTGTEEERFGVGDMYGHGVAAVRGNSYRRTFPEHGYVVSFVSVRPAAMYQNGIDRTWLRRTREEFFQKELAHIGQQEVWNGEVLADGSGLNDYGTFGYQDRYSEYREQRSSVAAEFRTTLDYWHLGRKFPGPAAPVLNASFVECDPSKRIFNVQSDHTLWIAAQHNLVARRMVGRNAAPRIL